MRALHLIAGLAAAACSTPEPDFETLAADPDRARAHLARCEAGQVARGCETARRALAEAGRRRRMAAYRETIEAGP